VFISAVEPSADAHCAALITALKQTTYDIDFVGVGGPKMAQAGCRILEVTVGKAAMIYNAFRHVITFYNLVRRITHYLKSTKVDLVVVCDSPAFNFHIAKAAKKLGIKTLFYVAPQLWAWGGWRITKLRKYCDKLCCILPFEQDWFAEKGIDAVYVGNPLLDGLDIDSAGQKRKYTDFQPKNAKFAIMPGSRAAEIDSLWLPMQNIALQLKQKYPQAVFTTVAVDSEREQLLRREELTGFECRYTVGSVSSTAAECDFAIVASGSATLQVAAEGCPMVIMYQSSRILWFLFGQWLLKTKYLSLVNILANRELVPEFMPYFSSIGPIVKAIEGFLSDRNKLSQLSGELITLAVSASAGFGSASQKVAQVAIEMLDKTCSG
jgi:lipid-A-disaccharide synthase